MDRAAGVIIIDENKPEPEALCLRVYANWDFPKGLIEPGETSKDAAIRETLEETGLTTLDYSISSIAPPITYGKKIAVYFLARRTSMTEPTLPINPELGKPEHDEWRWVPLKNLRTHMPNRFGPIIDYIENQYGI